MTLHKTQEFSPSHMTDGRDSAGRCGGLASFRSRTLTSRRPAVLTALPPSTQLRPEHHQARIPGHGKEEKEGKGYPSPLTGIICKVKTYASQLPNFVIQPNLTVTNGRCKAWLTKQPTNTSIA